MKTREYGGTEEIKYAQKLPYRKYGYFRDDEIVVLATHQEGTIPEDILKANDGYLRRSLDNQGIDSSISLTPRVNSYRRFPKAAEEDNDQHSMVSMLTYQLENTPEDPAYLLNPIGEYNKLQKDISNSGARIIGACPNWLTSVASQGAGTGGPGGRPSPYKGSRSGAPADFRSLITSLQQHNLYSGESFEEDIVDVAILDTAPSTHALVAAPKEYREHHLISSLLGTPGKFYLHPMIYDEVVRLGNTSLNDHDYNMTDHGLFVAGIIHSIAPKARIHLIEVLNQYGVGDLTSFVRGLEIVLNKIYDPKRKLVINCSWMLDFPRDDRHCRGMDQNNPDAEFENLVRQFSEQDQATAAMLETLFNDFSIQGWQAIAAAGNDGQEGDIVRVPPRYPAALEKVIGVGALPRTLRKVNGRYQASTYSNISDEPETKGIMTLGGEEGDGNGVLGIYIGEFPKYLNPSLWRRFLNWLIGVLGGEAEHPPNRSQWAWWAGTSFATPILSGTVAAVLGGPEQIATTNAAIEKLYKSQIIENSVVPTLEGPEEVGEDIFAVMQT